MDAITELLIRRVNTILPSQEELTKTLKSGKKLRLYQGFDPSSPDLHIGHLVGLLQLKAFQDLGHEVIFLIGDFTGMIGDPTDKSETRAKLTRKQVEENAKTYQKQAGRILRFEGKNAARMRFNSEWLKKLTLADVIELSSNFTVQQLIERDMFQKRIGDKKPIFLHEFMYPSLVTYDAIVLKVDLEIGGGDQLFNMTVGRPLIKQQINKDKFVLTTKLLADAAGNKIGKTAGNAINLFADANDLYGQIMSLSDEVVIEAFRLITEVPLAVIDDLAAEMKTRPMAVKKQLAFEVTKLCQGKEVAQAAQKNFELTVQGGKMPEKMAAVPIWKTPLTASATVARMVPDTTHSEIKRLMRQGGVEWNGVVITDVTKMITPKSGDVLKLGKRTFVRVKTDESK